MFWLLSCKEKSVNEFLMMLNIWLGNNYYNLVIFEI